MNRDAGTFGGSEGLGIASVREKKFKRHAGMQRFVDDVFAVEQHRTGLVAACDAPASLHDRVLSAADARGGRHRHDDSMLASASDDESCADQAV